jgi:hypothetical protein
MYNYYQVYDYDKKRIGFNGKVLDLDPKSAMGFPIWIVILIAGAVLIVALIIFFVIRSRNKKLEEALNQHTSGRI